MAPPVSKRRVSGLAVAAVAAAGLVAAIAHGADPPATAAFATVDSTRAFQRTAGIGSDAANAQIAIGGTVTFDNVASFDSHDVSFVFAGQDGVVCQQTLPAGTTSPDPRQFPVPLASGTWQRRVHVLPGARLPLHVHAARRHGGHRHRRQPRGRAARHHLRRPAPRRRPRAHRLPRPPAPRPRAHRRRPARGRPARRPVA